MNLFSFFKAYQPKGNWTKERFIQKYKYQKYKNMDTNLKFNKVFQQWLKEENNLILNQMNNTAKWLNEQIKSNKYNFKKVKLDNMFINKLTYLLGKNNDWLQNDNKYMQIQKDFRKVYNLPEFNFN